MNSARARAIYIIGLLGVVSLMFNSASSRVRLGAKDGVRKERCLIETDGKVHFKGPCWVGSSSGATHIVSIGRHRKPDEWKGRNPELYVEVRDGHDQISVWNGTGPTAGDKLHSYLGVMERNGPCWVTITRPATVPEEPREGSWFSNGRLEIAKYRPRAKVCAR